MSLDLKLIVDEFNLNLVRPSARSIYEFEEFRLDAEHLMLYQSDTEVPLTPKQVETLLALVEHRGEIVSKEALMSRLWGNTTVEESNLIQHIHFLRKVLGETVDGKPMIETLRRRGYRFNGLLKEPDQKSIAPRPEFRPQLVRNDRSDTRETASRYSSASMLPTGLGVLGLAVGFAILGYILFGLPASTPIKKQFAVLPLAPIDLSNRTESADLYELGVADALIVRLSSIDGFAIRPLSETRKYKDVNQDALAAGREQKTDYVLAPNYQLADGQIRITTQLWNVATGQVEQSYVFQTEASGIFSVQDAIAADIATHLMSKFGTTYGQKLGSRGTSSEEAYRLYQLGMAYADKGQRFSNQALESLNQAVALDPNYAAAWAGMARVVRPGYATGIQSEEEHKRSIAAINNALALDPRLADAYVSLCDVKLLYEYSPDAAEAACRKALELDPNSADAHLTYHLVLISRGRLNEALSEVKSALDLAPASFRVQRQYANTLYSSHRYYEAEEQYKRLLDYNPGDQSIYRRLIRTLEAEGKESEALDYVIKLEPLEGGDDGTVERLKQAYATSGWRGVTLERIALSERDPKAGPYWRAQWYAYLGDRDKAFENLEEALRNRSLILMFLRGDSHYFDSLRDDPRFSEFIKRVEGS